MTSAPDPWLGFALTPGFGPAKFQKICQYFGDPATAWAANFNDFIKAGIKENLAAAIVWAQKNFDLAEMQSKLKKQNIKTVRLIDSDYPKLLKQISDPPFLLFYRGSLASLARPCLAMVGSRKFTAYGQRVTQELAENLGARGITIISGLALGIDTFAHESCFNAGGATVAVLPGGVAQSDIIPQTNYWLAEKIAGADNAGSHLPNSIAGIGALIAEDAGAAIIGRNLTQKFSFPRRNRLISGLCLGVIIIEAPLKSGALITAYHALDQNREVFSVPGDIYRFSSQGVNELIKKGARLVASADDILTELNLAAWPTATATTLTATAKSTAPFSTAAAAIGAPKIFSATEKIILQNLTKQPVHVDKISQTSKIRVNVLLSVLMQMEIKGLIKNLGNQNYISLC